MVEIRKRLVDRIEALERQLAKARAEIEWRDKRISVLSGLNADIVSANSTIAAERNDAEAERDRLAAALTEIAGDVDGTWDEKFRAVQSIARAALAGKE